ncbi:hypothetical protein P692DRAFT_201933618 [Suillus brevipes Sb2]|nr:hypothetical protein P692DRAFT_201933618 [Suillus brevipes Sb2]
MTNNLPPKITTVPAGTPSTEWASKTESMLQSDIVTPDPAMRTTPKPEQRPVTITTNLSTPGHEFPGSYPREFEQELPKQLSCGDAAEGPAAASVVQAAKQYIPEPVERSVEYAGQTAAAYLPIPQGVKKTVASYWSNDENTQPKGTRSESEMDQQLPTSLPSSELKGAQPHEHVGGVGSLPGTISESSVALLPDERAEKDAQRMVNLKKDDSRTQGNIQTKSGAYSSGAAAVAAKPEDPSSRLQSSQYETQIDPQQADKSPARQTDQFPAKLFDPQPASVDHTPKHEVLEEQRSHDADIADVGGAAIGGVQTPPGKTTESGATKSAVAGGAIGASVENRTGDVGKVTGDRCGDEDIKHTHKSGARTGGYDTGDYHPAKLHPLRAGDSTSQAEVQPDTPVSPASAPPTSVRESSKERRVSFLDKVRGEARIFAGKITGKEDKVEEGKRMVHGKV